MRKLLTASLCITSIAVFATALVCVRGGVLPDLRYMAITKLHMVFEDIVLGGILKETGHG